MIRVLVAEDLPTARALVVEILRADPEIEVVGEATTGAEAVEMARRLQPDLVTMDILMPVMDGFAATRRLMAEMPLPIVIVSSLNVNEVTFAMQALEVGALAALPKPRGPGSAGFAEDSRRLVATVKAMSRVAVLRRPSRAAPPRRRASSGEVPVSRSFPRSRVLALAASTGGPAAFSTILGALPADFPAPILLVQHVAHGFSEGFANWLDGLSPLRVKVATAGEPLVPGTVYVAPDDLHLGTSADGSTVSLSAAPPVGSFRPSATWLFKSVAEAFGPFATGVILTGMGKDGVEGLLALSAAGGRVIGQDEATSVVYGMPGAAAEAGVVDVTLPLSSVAGTLRTIV